MLRWHIFDTYHTVFDTMAAEREVKYLKIDRGRYYYQRRVPNQFRELLGISKWQMPCGDVSYAKAVQLVVKWAEEHDVLLTKLRFPEGYDAIEAEVLRANDIHHRTFMDSVCGTALHFDGEDLVAFDDKTKPWQVALQEVSELDECHTKPKAPEHEVLQLKAKIVHAIRGGPKLGKIRLSPYPEFIELAQAHILDSEIVEFEFTQHPPRPMSDEGAVRQI